MSGRGTCLGGQSKRNSLEKLSSRTSAEETYIYACESGGDSVSNVCTSSRLYWNDRFLSSKCHYCGKLNWSEPAQYISDNLIESTRTWHVFTSGHIAILCRLSALSQSRYMLWSLGPFVAFARSTWVIFQSTFQMVLIIIIIDNFCIALFSGVPKLTALYILQHFLSFTNIIHIIMTTNNV